MWPELSLSLTAFWFLLQVCALDSPHVRALWRHRLLHWPPCITLSHLCPHSYIPHTSPELHFPLDIWFRSPHHPGKPCFLPWWWPRMWTEPNTTTKTKDKGMRTSRFGSDSKPEMRPHHSRLYDYHDPLTSPAELHISLLTSLSVPLTLAALSSFWNQRGT